MDLTPAIGARAARPAVPVPDELDAETLAAAHDRWFGDIYRYVAGRLDTDAAEDVAAETFLVAFRRRRRFDPARGELRPWLFGIATNLVARHRRAEARHLRALARVGAEPPAEGHESHVVATVALGPGDRRAALPSARAILPPRLRGPKTRGAVVELSEPAPFRLAGEALTRSRLRGLPAEPAALKAWIVGAGRRGRLVVDPATSRVRATSFLVTVDGAELWLPRGRTATVAAGWTDRPPPGTR